MKSIDLTDGSILKLMIRFAIPLFIGTFLQNLYNAFDAVIVGNYINSGALAAVGAAGPFINMIIAFFFGLSMGASVLISQAFGARDHEDMRGVIHTAVALAALLGLALSVIGIAATPVMLRLMRTPEEIIPEAVVYLRVYFGGMAALTIYNIGAAILTAVGDTFRPLYFLIISTIIKIIGSLLAVGVFGLGIAGVAYSTVLAQIVTATLVTISLCGANGPHRLNLRALRVDIPYVKRIFRIGMPGGVQTAIISASNIIVQFYINMMGAQAIAGYSATSRLDAFIMLPIQTMGATVTTFVGQNLGAGMVRRARRGVKTAVSCGLVLTVAISILTLIYGRSLLRIFSPEYEVIEYGMRFLRVFAPLYFVMCFSQIIPGALRGAGDVRMAMLTCIGSFVGLRQIYLFIITKITYSPETVALGFPLTWAVAGAILTIYYLKSDWSRFERHTPGRA